MKNKITTNLQPLPTYAKPNVSGNINAHLTPAVPTANSNQIQAPSQQNEPIQNPSQSLFWPIISFTIITIIGIFILRKLKKKPEQIS